MNFIRVLLSSLAIAGVSGCQTDSPHSAANADVGGVKEHGLAPPGAASVDKRVPAPLLPHMARHQLENMRDHLAAIQEILAALATSDFDEVGRAAARIESSSRMEQMCNHMGAGAPGFTPMALGFHRTADGIGVAARSGDEKAVLRAVSATLGTCVACHAAYRQEVVDEATWQRLTRRGE
jgi:hypothetical protein